MNTNNTTQPETQTVINQVVDFYGQYLSCSPEQLDLLALWTLHTHCFQSAPFSPPLNISSRRPQSGKTLCLELLSLRPIPSRTLFPSARHRRTITAHRRPHRRTMAPTRPPSPGQRLCPSRL